MHEEGKKRLLDSPEVVFNLLFLFTMTWCESRLVEQTLCTWERPDYLFTLFLQLVCKDELHNFKNPDWNMSETPFSVQFFSRQDFLHLRCPNFVFLQDSDFFSQNKNNKLNVLISQNCEKKSQKPPKKQHKIFQWPYSSVVRLPASFFSVTKQREFSICFLHLQVSCMDGDGFQNWTEIFFLSPLTYFQKDVNKTSEPTQIHKTRSCVLSKGCVMWTSFVLFFSYPVEPTRGRAYDNLINQDSTARRLRLTASELLQ